MNADFKPKISIGHAVWRTGLTVNFYLSMLSVIKSYRGVIELIVKGDISVAWARNLIVEEFLSGGSEYLFFVDADISMPPDSLTRLIKHNKDICSGLYFMRKPPHYPLIMDRNPDTDRFRYRIKYPEGLVETDGCGAGCLLIKREVLEKVERPWFLEPDGKTSDDMYFLIKAKEAGFGVYVDTTIKCGHDSEHTVNEELFRQTYFKEG